MTSYSNGPHDLGGDCHAWLLPEGHWGESNTGLIRGDGESLLVDTHLDLAHTAEMLDAFSALTVGQPAISQISRRHAPTPLQNFTRTKGKAR